MKKVLIVLCLAGGFSGYAQTLSAAKIPSGAATAFQQRFPGAKNVKWEKEDGNFEANFESEGKKASAVYSAAGVLMETEYVLEPKKLPGTITHYIAANYKGAVTEASRVEKPNNPPQYEAVVDGQELLFGPNGQFISAKPKK
jgi:hypothetical protein